MEQLEVTNEGAMIPSFHAVAVNATEMVESRRSIHNFLDAKVAEIEQEYAEMSGAYEVAVARKWASTPLKNQVRRIEKRLTYYRKLVAAMEAGFVIVPNMAVDVFAIRVKSVDPKWFSDYGESLSGFRSASPVVPDEKDDALPAGMGTYQSPLVDFTESQRVIERDGIKVYTVNQRSNEYKDIEFPLAAAHPVVMNATNRAMVMKIFDRIGIVPQTGRKLRGDPIILGQIIRREGYTEKIASFLIAWHLDMRTL